MNVLRTGVTKHRDLVQKQHNRHYDNKARSTRSFKPGQMIFDNKPLLATLSARNVESLPKTSYIKLIPQVMKTFDLFNDQSNTLSIDNHIIHNTD